ncbi:transketolase, partial [bacterium]
MPNYTGIVELSINTIRFLALDAIQKADSGHPGICLGAAPMAYVLWERHLKFYPQDPKWPDRDRFVLSAGHGSALLYAMLHLTGYDIAIEDIKRFRQFGSKTPGHPERNVDIGVEATTGPLGQGIANAVGLAIAEAHLAARFNKPGHNIVDHYTYVIAGDGDLMEGVSYEACALAGHLGLGKLIVLYDDNEICLSGATKLVFTEDIMKRFEACGWQYQQVEDGNDVEAIDKAIDKAKAETSRPSIISVKTVIGYGSPKQGSAKCHGAPFGIDKSGEKEVEITKRNLGWPTEPAFLIPDEVKDHFQKTEDKGGQAFTKWKDDFSSYKKAFPDLADEFDRRFSGN